MINGITEIVLTKLDVLNNFSEIGVCTGYQLDGRTLKYFPSECGSLERVDAQYQMLPGWNTSLEGCRTWEDLPAAARDYIKFIEEFVGAKVTYLGTGPGREQIVIR